MKKAFVGAIAAVSLIVLTYAMTTTWLMCKWEDRGNFGQMFGGLDALFSGCAFAGFIIALIWQQKELREQRQQLEMQREELKLVRVELTRSAVAQEKSQEALCKQAACAELEVELVTLNNLLSFYGQSRAQIPPNFIRGSAEEKQWQELNDRISTLNERVNQIYSKLIEKKAESARRDA